MTITKKPKTINFNELRADKLVEYIISAHNSNIKNALTRFGVHLKTIIKVDTGLHPEVKKISLLVNEIKELIEQHLALEERILFPYITKMITEPYSDVMKKDHLLEHPLKKIKHEHLQMTELLETMRALSDNYIPRINSSPALKLLYAQLFDFEQDIHKHIFLEENILFPKVIEIEKRITNG